jgi:exosortase
MTDNPLQNSLAGKASGSSLADMVAVSAGPSFAQAFPPATRLKIAILAVLLAAVNYWQFPVLVGTWLSDANWTHGFLIPLFSAYLIYSRREELFAARRRVCLLGLPLMLLALMFIILGFYPIGTYWISQLNITLLLFGLVLYLAGPQVARITWVPIFYLALAMPIPDLLYARLAVPLQEFAAKGATILLQLAGVEMDVTASNLQIRSLSGHEHSLTVAEACSGMRSLMAYVALGVAWAYLEYRPLWHRITLVAATVPIAIFINVVRVAITCTMYVVDRPELGQDFMHGLVGMAMLVPALLLLWLLNWLLNSLFVEEEEPPQGGEAEAP